MVRNNKIISHQLMFDEAVDGLKIFHNLIISSDALQAVHLVQKTEKADGWTTLCYKFNGKLSHKLNVAAAGIFKNLKDALDQALVYYGKKLGNPNTQELAFPIGPKPRKNKSLHPEFQYFLSKISNRENARLSLLSKFSNESKHQHIIGVSILPSLEVQMSFMTNIGVPCRFYFNSWDDQAGELDFLSFAPGGSPDLTNLPKPEAQPVIFGIDNQPLPAFAAFLDVIAVVKGILAEMAVEADRLGASSSDTYPAAP